MSNFNVYPINLKNRNTIRLSDKIRQLQVAINSFGVQLNCHTDFEIFNEIAMNHSEIGHVTGIFDEQYNQIGADNGFWIKATNQCGEIVHLQALRYDDLTGKTLADLWQERPLLYAPAGYDIDIGKSDFNTAPATYQMSGSVCYHGEFWLDQAYRKFELGALLSKFGTLKAWTRFSPDYIYGFVPPKLIKRGWAARQGYLHMHPWAPRWRIRGTREYYDEYLVWISGAELISLWTTRQRDIDVLSWINVGNHGDPAAGEHITS